MEDHKKAILKEAMLGMEDNSEAIKQMDIARKILSTVYKRQNTKQDAIKLKFDKLLLEKYKSEIKEEVASYKIFINDGMYECVTMDNGDSYFGALAPEEEKLVKAKYNSLVKENSEKVVIYTIDRLKDTPFGSRYYTKSHAIEELKDFIEEDNEDFFYDESKIPMPYSVMTYQDNELKDIIFNEITDES